MYTIEEEEGEKAKKLKFSQRLESFGHISRLFHYKNEYPKLIFTQTVRCILYIVYCILF